MDKWNELRTAYTLATLGTVSAAADSLGIHRATVIRHLDALEAELGGKIFLRHTRGYTPTEAGLDLLRVGEATEEQFRQLAGRIAGRDAEVSGELIVTSVELVAPLLMPAMARFRAEHPNTTVRYIVSGRVFELAYGEAHVAVRAGPRPEHPDNVVRPWLAVRTGLYAHRGYIAEHGLPTSDKDLAGHAFIGGDEGTVPLPFLAWLKTVTRPEQEVFTSANQRIKFQALLSGLGVGFFPAHQARNHPELVEVIAPRPEWDTPFWLVTHVDLHRSAKVQAFLGALQADAGGPP
jgi:DNA-binding transcriptional LysR family regulator